MTAPSQARALAAAIERNVVALRGPDGNLPPEVEVAYYNLKDALLDAPQPLDRETLCLTEEEHEEAYAQFRRLDAAGDPYALDKLLVHWAHRLRPRLVGPTGTTGPFGRNK